MAYLKKKAPPEVLETVRQLDAQADECWRTLQIVQNPSLRRGGSGDTRGGDVARMVEAASQPRVGMDVSYRTLQLASERLGPERLAPMQRRRINLIHGSLVYRDVGLAGFDAAALVEVIEHLDRARMATCERVVFEFAQPSCVIVTTPNAEYNGGHFARR